MNKQLLELFCEPDSRREYCQYPCNHCGYAIGTNGKVMCFRQDESNILELPPCPNKGIAFNQYLLELSAISTHSLSVLRNLEHEQVYPEIECNVCEGNGEFEKGGDTYSCQKCGCAGIIITTDEPKINNPNQRFELNGAIFNYQYLEKIIQAADILKAQTFDILKIEKNKACFFNVGYYTILIMPVICAPISTKIIL